MAIKGLDGLNKKLNGAATAFEGLPEEIGAIAFDPADPASVENAITGMEALIDARIRKHKGNAIVKIAGEGLKDQYREMIAGRVAG